MSNNRILMSRIDKEVVCDKSIDYFIMAITGEERCYRVIDILLEQNVVIGNLVLVKYDKYEEDIDLDVIIEKYEEYVGSIKKITCKKNEDDHDGIQIALMGIDDNSSVGFDITNFAIPDVFRLLYVFDKIIGCNFINIFYTEPKYYHFEKGLFTTYESVGGEREYKVLEEYSNSDARKKEILVCFLGFDRNVAKHIYDLTNPFDTVIINGFPSYLPKLKDVSLLNNYELISTVGKESVVSVRANSPYTAYNCLKSIKDKYPQGLLNICVLGTKPMAVGAALFSLKNRKSVKVSFPYPREYKQHTSRGYEASWSYKIDLR